MVELSRVPTLLQEKNAMRSKQDEREHRAAWSRQYRRNYELDRAIEKARVSAVILVVGFVVFALSFVRAWIM
jgi:hypothetical protein